MKNLIKTTAVLTTLVILLSAFSVTAFAESGYLVHGTFNFDYANEMADYINDYREQNGLEKLENDFSLVEPAMIRAAECSVNFSHIRPNTKSWSTVADWEEAVAENIAKGFSNPREATDGYYNSEGHRINMLGDYTRMGVGVFTDDNGLNYWIHIFTRGDVQRSYKEKGKRSVIVSIGDNPDAETQVVYSDGLPSPTDKALEYEKDLSPDIASVSLSKTVFVYNGRSQAPKITVRDKNGNKISDKYYSVNMPSKHTFYGVYTIKVSHKLKNQSFNKKFKIIPKAVAINKMISKSKKSVTVKWKSVSPSATGVKLCVAKDEDFTEGKKTYTISRTKRYKSVKGLKKGTTYYFKLRTYKKSGDEVYYSDWSSVKKIKR